MIRRLTQVHPGINIVPIDYDLSATKVNQENRIRLMLAVAHDVDASAASRSCSSLKTNQPARTVPHAVPALLKAKSGRIG